MTVTSKTYIRFKIGLGALMGAGSFMAIPPYRLWALATLPMLAVAGFSMPNRRNRLLLVAAYILSGLGGFAIGQFFWRTDELSWSGIKFMVLLLIACAIAAVRIFVAKSDEA